MYTGIFPSGVAQFWRRGVLRAGGARAPGGRAGPADRQWTVWSRASYGSNQETWCGRSALFVGSRAAESADVCNPKAQPGYLRARPGTHPTRRLTARGVRARPVGGDGSLKLRV